MPSLVVVSGNLTRGGVSGALAAVRRPPSDVDGRLRHEKVGDVQEVGDRSHEVEAVDVRLDVLVSGGIFKFGVTTDLGIKIEVIL